MAASPSAADAVMDASGLSVINAIVMVANCAIGAGVLAFPFAVRCCGVAVGAAVIVCGAGLLTGSLHILASCLMRLGADKEALPYAIEADAMARRVLPEGHPSRKGAAEALAKIRASVSSGK